MKPASGDEVVRRLLLAPLQEEFVDGLSDQELLNLGVITTFRVDVRAFTQGMDSIIIALHELNKNITASFEDVAALANLICMQEALIAQDKPHRRKRK